MEESKAAAKDLKLLQREQQQSVQESEEANTKVINCINLDVLQSFIYFDLLSLSLYLSLPPSFPLSYFFSSFSFPPLSLSLSLSLFLSVSLSLCLSVSLSRSLSVSFSVSLSLSVSFSVSLSLVAYCMRLKYTAACNVWMQGRQGCFCFYLTNSN